MNCAPTSGAPSSPDSARKITSRSSAAFDALEHQHEHEARDEVVLVVDRSAPVDVAAVANGAERRMRPLLRVHGDDVGVAHDEHRLLLAVALDADDEVRALRDRWRRPDTECPPCRAPASDSPPRALRCPADCSYRAAGAPGSAEGSPLRSPTRRCAPARRAASPRTAENDARGSRADILIVMTLADIRLSPCVRRELAGGRGRRAWRSSFWHRGIRARVAPPRSAGDLLARRRAEPDRSTT